MNERVNLADIVKDIRRLATSIDKRWKRDRATWGVWSDARRIQRTVDMDALQRCIAFVLNQPPADGVKGYQAAERLDAVLRIIEQHRAEIEERLMAA